MFDHYTHKDVLYAFMYHEIAEVRKYNHEFLLMEIELEEQQRYYDIESGFYENLEIERRMNIESDEQLLYMETNVGYIKDIKPYVPSYVESVERITELLNSK